mmetsp:Transcript_64079/g.111701  ORF Transcript_64079/g.111701 Transcript_64079/m.111701 type:complete len:997 (-) Transcript_64079:79-3069(-)
MGASQGSNVAGSRKEAEAWEDSAPPEAAKLIKSPNKAPVWRCAVLKIGGMTCSNCSSAVQRALSGLAEVQKCEVDLINEKATVQYMESKVFSAKSLCEEVEDIGFEAELIEDSKEGVLEAGRATIHLHDKSEEAAQASSVFLEQLSGILNVEVRGNRLKVAYDPAIIGARALLQVLQFSGHSSTWNPAGSTADSTEEAARHQKALIKELLIALVLTAMILIVCWILPCFEHCRSLLHYELLPGLQTMTICMCLLSLPVQVFSGRRFHYGAYHSMRTGIWDMNVLISIGTGLTYLYSILVVIFAAMLPQVFGVHNCKAPPTSYFEAPCMIITFILVGKALESWAKHKTSESLRHLLALQPTVAHLLHADAPSGKPETIPAEFIELGDVLQIFPGDVAPVDGIMLGEGCAAEFDESLLTGESLPVQKRKGDFIVGGSKCAGGRAEMKVERLGNKTTLSQIAALMEKAQLSRAPVQHVADIVARIFVPCVVELAIATWVVWYVLVYRTEFIPMTSILEERESEWPELDKFFFVLEHGLTVLLVACPCALGLATPTAVMTSTGVAARNGILVRSGAVPLELGSKVTHMVLDKTGTLTNGKPKVVRVAAFHTTSQKHDSAWDKLKHAQQKALGTAVKKQEDDVSPEIEWLTMPPAKADGEQICTDAEAKKMLWWVVGVAEMSSEHVLAKELVSVASAVAGGALSKPTDFQNITGAGVKCAVAGLQVQVGSVKHILGSGEQCSSAILHWIRSARRDGSTVICVAIDGEPIAAIALRDTLSPHARTSVAQLQASGIELWMCTGDHESSARAIARECGINPSKIVTEALPADKVAIVEWLQSSGATGHENHPLHTSLHYDIKGRTRTKFASPDKKKKRHVVAMVGDGLNDAPALATADLGVAIGAGHNVTVDAADVVLVRADLRDLVSFVALARETLATIWRNFLWAFIFNTCSLPIASGALWHFRILMTPEIACVLMLTSSLLVVFSSLSLRKFTPNEAKCEV